MLNRRQFLKLGLAAGAGFVIRLKTDGVGRGQLGGTLQAEAAPAVEGLGLSDPAKQPLFANPVPDALAPTFKFRPKRGRITVGAGPSVQMTGLVGPDGVTPVPTPVWGYGDSKFGYTWPGKTFEVQSGEPLEVRWENHLGTSHLLPVDTSLHWAYSLEGYTDYSIGDDGVPIVTHLHGGHSNFQYDGNPEFFFSPGFVIKGPQWREANYLYDQSQPAGTLWYHDHALGITRLNVYAGLAGFYIIRDEFDTGKANNPFGLPAWPFEKAYAIQDRMFLETGELFYPAFPGDPAWADFITGEGLEDDDVPQPSALAEFFGDHMVVNGVIWPYEEVEPRNYRMRLLNGTDSRFMALRFRAVDLDVTDPNYASASDPLPFQVIGSDQGLASAATETTLLLFEPGSRYDIVFDFSMYTGKRIIMENIGGDEPFGGTLTTGDPDLQIFDYTDRVMAFDVVVPLEESAPAFDPTTITNPDIPVEGEVDRTRKLGLFEGLDEYGRLQPLLGTAEPATDYAGNDINWPDTAVYSSVGLTGQMEGSIGWHSPTTENPELDTTEVWDVFNVTGDAHPIHLHLVHFDVVERREINWDSNVDEEGFIPEGDPPAGDGIYLVSQPIVQHNSVAGDPDTYGEGFRIVQPPEPDDAYGDVVYPGSEYVENAPKDMVTALPDQITRIKAHFDKPGRYVWHCHILSHEDHEMMRVLYVGPGAHDDTYASNVMGAAASEGGTVFIPMASKQ